MFVVVLISDDPYDGMPFTLVVGPFDTEGEAWNHIKNDPGSWDREEVVKITAPEERAK